MIYTLMFLGGLVLGISWLFRRWLPSGGRGDILIGYGGVYRDKWFLISIPLYIDVYKPCVGVLHSCGNM